MTAGFGTIAGSVLGAYLGFGVSLVKFVVLRYAYLKFEEYNKPTKSHGWCCDKR